LPSSTRQNSSIWIMLMHSPPQKPA
jgi:hypothetical protein